VIIELAGWLAAYVVGSIPSGLWLGRAIAGVDVRTVGSRRTGATNVQRTLGTGAGVAVLVLDAGKGALGVILLHWLTGSDYAGAIGGAAAMAGHIWPVWAGFRGGRGVATAAGAMVLLAPAAFICTLALMAAVVLVTRYVSLGSMAAAVSAPILVVGLRGRTPESDGAILLTLLAVVIVLSRHTDNLERLRHRRESKLGAAGPHVATPPGEEL
jgi:glycerol-3-phosphate acyltransferase PlsY